MKKIKKEQNRLNRGVVAKTILKCLAGAGLLTMAILAPNAIQSLSMFGIGKRKYHLNSYLKTTVNNLHRRGMIDFRQDGENRYIVLTEKGEKILAEYEVRDYLFTGSKTRWDGKWRVVIFDIHEKDRALRNMLRDSLTNIGFEKVQNSVWVFPYDCEDFIFLLKTNFELGKNVLYLVVDRLENDKWLREGFGLE